MDSVRRFEQRDLAELNGITGMTKPEKFLARLIARDSIYRSVIDHSGPSFRVFPEGQDRWPAVYDFLMGIGLEPSYPDKSVDREVSGPA